MQINYDYWNDRRASALFWNSPDIGNSIQDLNVPVVYAPYGTSTFWPDGSTAPADSSIAPNSSVGTTVKGAMSGLGRLGDTGTQLTPDNLVAAMPSIVKPPAPQQPQSSCGISNWVSDHTGLAVLAAIAVFALTAGGGK